MQMKGFTRASLVGLALVASGLIGAFGVLASGGAEAQAGPAPATVAPAGSAPAPPWVRSDGTVDFSKMPATIGAVAVDGSPLRDASGREVQLPFRGLYGPSPNFAEQDRVAAQLRELQEADARRRGLAPPRAPDVRIQPVD